MQSQLKILVVQIGKIGDMILTTPLLIKLKELYPGSDLSVLAGNKNSVITYNLSVVNRTYEFRKNIFSSLKLIHKLRKEHFDFWIDIKDEYSSTSKHIKNLCSPKMSLGFNFGKNYFDVNLMNYVSGGHKVDINLSPIRYLADVKEFDRIMPRIDIPEIDSDNVKKRIENIKGGKVLLNISAGLVTRDLETWKWIKLADGINPEYNIILTGQDKDYENIKAILKSIKRKNVLFVETNTIFELAELIKNCKLIVTPDTSAVHIASCFNTPVVCFFHNVEWVIAKFAPLSETQRIVISKDENSFKSINPEELLNAVNELLS